MATPASALQIHVSIEFQKLDLLENGQSIFSAPVSTAAKGPGFEEGSYCTPTGDFMIRERIGEGAPIFTSFKGRLPRGVWKGEESTDAILSRILWLEGICEDNLNTYSRYIYFHGTHAENMIGQPASHGCIRLKNKDMITLFDLTPISTPVHIS